MHISDLNCFEIISTSDIKSGSLSHSESFSGVSGTGSASFLSSATSDSLKNFAFISSSVSGSSTAFGSAQAGGSIGFLLLT